MLRRSLKGGRILRIKWRFIRHHGLILWTFSASNVYYSLHSKQLRCKVPMLRHECLSDIWYQANKTRSFRSVSSPPPRSIATRGRRKNTDRMARKRHYRSSRYSAKIELPMSKQIFWHDEPATPSTTPIQISLCLNKTRRTLQRKLMARNSRTEISSSIDLSATTTMIPLQPQRPLSSNFDDYTATSRPCCRKKVRAISTLGLVMMSEFRWQAGSKLDRLVVDVRNWESDSAHQAPCPRPAAIPPITIRVELES